MELGSVQKEHNFSDISFYIGSTGLSCRIPIYSDPMQDNYVVILKASAALSSLGLSCQTSVGAGESDLSGHGGPCDLDGLPVFAVSEEVQQQIKEFVTEFEELKKLDRVVHLAGLVSALLLKKSGWLIDREAVGIFIGSSRGATASFESSYQNFLGNDSSRLSPLTSPVTTLGNLSSSLARIFHVKGIHSSHSVTCSTSLHAILNGMAWLKSGLAKRVVVGGAEAPLTPFTLAQMKALKIYSKIKGEWPCRPMAVDQSKNTFVLGEGAACFAMELKDVEDLQRGDIYIAGFGFDTEFNSSLTAISKDGSVFQNTMYAACKAGRPDLVLVHAPGTLLGDRAELQAIKAVFGTELPAILSNKFLVGHTFGASGALSMDYACAILRSKRFIPFPYPSIEARSVKDPKSVLVNSTGFGGNAVSILIKRH